MQCATAKATYGYVQARCHAVIASRKYDQPMQHYRCALCSGWHVGSFVPMPKPLRTIRNNHNWRLL